MKRFMICAALCWITTDFCAQANLYKSNNSTALLETLPKNPYQHIVDVMLGEKDTFVVVVSSSPTPMENHLGVITCDLGGRILDATDFVIPLLSFVRSTNDPNIPIVWLGAAGWTDDPELWLAERDGAKLKPRLLLKRGDDDLLLHKCWLLEVGGKKKLFVEKYEFKEVRIKGELELLPKYWLYCYALENDSLKLEGKALIAESKIKSVEFGVECVLIGREIFVWVCEEGGQWSTGVLRVAQWRNDGELKWIECYKEKKGQKLRELTVDRLNGSAAVIFRYSKGRWNASCTFCQFEGNKVSCVDLGHDFASFPAKKQLLSIREPRMAWLLLHGMRIVALDGKVREISRQFRHTSDVQLARGNEQEVYIIILTEDGQIKIEKLEQFAAGKATGAIQIISP